MKSLFWFVCIVVLGLCLMTLAGIFVPRHHKAVVTAHLAADPEIVFGTLVDSMNAPEWRPEIERVERLAPLDGKASYREYGDHGPVTYVVEEFTPSSHLVIAIDDDKLAYGGRWTYALEPEDGGTRITITEDGFVRNPLLRFLAHHVLSQTATLERYLADLGAHHGGTVSPEVVLLASAER